MIIVQQRFLLFVLWLSFVVITTAAVADSPLYTVKVSVDITESCAAEAKEQALSKAREKAFSKLLSRLSVQEDIGKKPEFLEEISEYIKSFSIQQEERSSVRYRAVVQFYFDANKVQMFLKKQGIPFSEVRSIKLVVLPILIKNGRFILWDEEENIWHKIWATSSEETESVEVICPLADLEDQMLAPIAALSDLKKPTLLQLKDRYKADDVLIAVLSLDGEEQGALYRGYIRFLPFSLDDHQNTRAIGPFSFSQPSDLLPKKEVMIEQLQLLWKEKNLTRKEEQGVIKIELESNEPRQWKESLKKVKNLPMVQSIMIQSLSKGKTVVWVHFSGDLNHFEEKLAYEGFTVEGDHSLMILRR